MIYTFYSFKGGVGRSMALANVGEWLHEKGLRVLLVDWDLEAPGLESYFHLGDDAREALLNAQAHPGLMDMLFEYRKAFPRWLARRRSEQAADKQPQPTAEDARQVQEVLARSAVPAYLMRSAEPEVPVSFPEFLAQLYTTPASPSATAAYLGSLADSPFRQYLQCLLPPDNGGSNGLYLLAAGARPANQFGLYAQKVQEFNWGEFYASYEGREYFSWFREQLTSGVDVVLIDSRTGVTEMSGV
jgi:hypothetical protein